MQTRYVFLNSKLLVSYKIINISNPQLRKGVSGARGDDTRGLKSAVLDWITPQGQTLSPALARNQKDDRGFKHERTGALLCPIDLDWSNTE